MDAQAILATARSGQVPYQWNIWPLRRGHVLRGAIGWLAIGAIGLLLLIPALLLTIPSNLTGGALGVFFTILGLGVLALMASGGLGLAGYDFWRVRHAAEFLLVLTPDDFVKAQPGRVTHVPLEDIAYITLKGSKAQAQMASQDVSRDMMVLQRARLGQLFGAGMMQRGPKRAQSLAFVDTRDQSQVVVATDDSFEDPSVLEQLLSTYVFGKQRQRGR